MVGWQGCGCRCHRCQSPRSVSCRWCLLLSTLSNCLITCCRSCITRISYGSLPANRKVHTKKKKSLQNPIEMNSPTSRLRGFDTSLSFSVWCDGHDQCERLEDGPFIYFIFFLSFIAHCSTCVQVVKLCKGGMEREPGQCLISVRQATRRLAFFRHKLCLVDNLVGQRVSKRAATVVVVIAPRCITGNSTVVLRS